MNNHINRAYMNNPSMYEQNLYEQIDGQINQLVNMKNQLRNNIQQPQQPTAINQTFQLSPNSNGMKYANSIEEVEKETVFYDTPFFSKDLSVVWVKNMNGNIKAYELTEIVKKDEKDIQIEMLQAQIEELKREMMNNAKPNDDDVIKPIEDEKSSNVSNGRASTKKSK